MIPLSPFLNEKDNLNDFLNHVSDHDYRRQNGGTSLPDSRFTFRLGDLFSLSNEYHPEDN